MAFATAILSAIAATTLGDHSLLLLQGLFCCILASMTSFAVLMLAGCAFLVAAIVAQPIKIWRATFPALKRLRHRVISAILGFALIALAIFLGFYQPIFAWITFCKSLHPAPTPELASNRPPDLNSALMGRYILGDYTPSLSPTCDASNTNPSESIGTNVGPDSATLPLYLHNSNANPPTSPGRLTWSNEIEATDFLDILGRGKLQGTVVFSNGNPTIYWQIGGFRKQPCWIKN